MRACVCARVCFCVLVILQINFFIQISTIVWPRRVNMTEYALTSRTATNVHVLRDTPASNVKLVRYLEHVTLLYWCRLYG